MIQNPLMSQVSGVPLAPLTPDAAISAFSYLRAVEAGDTEAAAGSPAPDPRMHWLLVDAAKRIVVPVTALCGIDPDPCDDSFALAAVERVLMTTLGNWASQARSDFGRSRASTASLTVIGCKAPGRPAPRAELPISPTGHPSSRAAAFRPMGVRLRSLSPLGSCPPFSARPCLHRSDSAPVGPTVAGSGPGQGETRPWSGR